MSEARALSLYLATLGPAACAVLAWLPELPRPSLLALCLGYGLAVAAGEAYAPALRTLRDRGAYRARAWLLSFSAGVAFLALAFSAAAPRAPLLARATLLLAALQLVYLLLPGLGPGRVPALGLGAALLALASFRGGLPAAAAAVAGTGGTLSFLVFDHFSRRLAQLPEAAAPLGRVAAAEAARAALPPLLVLALWFAAAPPRPHAGLDAATLDSLAGRERVAAAYLQLAFFTLIGASLVHYAMRLLRRRKDARGPTTEAVAVERGACEALPETPPRTRPSYAGARGSVVRAYVRFLAAAAGAALRRRPDQTPNEIAALIPSAGAPLVRLTAAFGEARYGPAEPSPAEVAEADTLSAALLGWLQSRRDSGNAASGRQPPTSPSVRTT